MNINTIFVIGIITMMVMTSCTSTIRTIKGAEIDKIKVGEQVTIYEDSGEKSTLLVMDITDAGIVGQYRQRGNLVTVPRNGIEYVQVERTDYVKSAGAGVGIVLGAGLIFAFGLFLFGAMAGLGMG